MAYPIVKEVQARFGDRLRFVFRKFPIGNAHPHAAEAADAQARFWEMHDHLYEHQRQLDDRDLVDHARAPALDGRAPAG